MKRSRQSKRNRKVAEEQVLPETVQSRITELFDIPSSALGGMAQIEISGNQEAVVDGCRGILEYDESVIRLAAEKMSIRFSGRGLQIKVLTHDSAVVTGFITGIEFLV